MRSIFFPAIDFKDCLRMRLITKKMIAEQIERSAALNASIMVQIGIFDRPPSLRGGIAYDSLMIALEHHGAIACLCHHDHFGSAHTLLRPLLEAYAQGLWLLYAAEHSQIKQFLERKFTWTLPKLTGMLVKKKPFPAIARLREFDDLSSKLLNSYAHNGLELLSRRADGFKTTDIQLGLLIADGTALLATACIAQLFDAESLREFVFAHTVERARQYGQTPVGPRSAGLPPLPNWNDPDPQ